MKPKPNDDPLRKMWGEILADKKKLAAERLLAKQQVNRTLSFSGMSVSRSQRRLVCVCGEKLRGIAWYGEEVGGCW